MSDAARRRAFALAAPLAVLAALALMLVDASPDVEHAPKRDTRRVVAQEPATPAPPPPDITEAAPVANEFVRLLAQLEADRLSDREGRRLSEISTERLWDVLDQPPAAGQARARLMRGRVRRISPEVDGRSAVATGRLGPSPVRLQLIVEEDRWKVDSIG